MTDLASAPLLTERRFGLPPSMGPSSALAAEDEPLRLLMTDFVASPFERPLGLPAGFDGFGAASAALDSPPSALFVDRGETGVVGAAPATLVSVLLLWVLLCLVALFEVSPPKAKAADELIGADMDKADFRSDWEVLRFGCVCAT